MNLINEVKWLFNKDRLKAQKKENLARNQRAQQSSQAQVLRQTADLPKRLVDHAKTNKAKNLAIKTGNYDQLTDQQYEKTIEPGTTIQEGGKTLYWSGENYGWQSKGSYDKLESQGQFRRGEDQAQRVNSDIGGAIQGLLGEEGTRRLGLAIQTAGDLYEQHTPQPIKDALGAAGSGLQATNQFVSEKTNIGPTLTSEALTEAALMGSGQLVKGGGRVIDKVQPLSRAQEAIRDARGLGAKALNTGGSVGAAGAPLSARQRLLRSADAYTGPRLDNDAADGIQKISTKTAPKNTVNSQGQTRGADKAKRVQQNAQQQAVEARRQELLTQRDQNLRMIGYEQAASARRPNATVEQFGQQTRGQQAQQNVVRRREAADNNGRNTWRRREQDAQSRGGNGTGALPMENAYDTVTNIDRVGVAGNAPGTVRAGSANARIQAPRNRNTVDGRRVINDSETRALRQRETDSANRAARRAQQRIDHNQEELVLRNQLKGKPARQKAAVERARKIGNDGLAEANTARRNSPNKTGLKRQGVTTESSRPANTLKAAKQITKKAKASEKAREVAKAQRKANRSKAGLKARQGSGNNSSTATYTDGKQPAKGGKEGSRLFTPRNRAEAAQREGSKLNAQHTEGSRNTAMAAGKAAYANKHSVGRGTVHDVGFRSTNLRNGYARDTERKLRGDKVAPKSRTKRQQDSAVIKNNLATVFARVKEGDVVTASPIEGIKGRNGRAKLYDRMSKGALKSDADDQIHSRRLADNKWKNTKGEVKDWDPEILRQDLEALTKITPEQLRGKAIGGNSSLRVKATGASTKTRGLETPSTSRTTKTQSKRQKEAMERLSQFAKLSGLSTEDALKVLRDQL